MMTTDELRKVIQQSHAELVSRGAKDAFVKTSAVLSWTDAVLLECRRHESSAYLLACFPKNRATIMRNACVVADDFVRGLGSWTADEFVKLQKLCIRATIEHLKTKQLDPSDVEMILVSLRDVARAFAAQFPGYIEGGMLGFLLHQEDA